MESIATETVTLGQLHQTLKEVYRKLNSLTMKITNVEADMRAVRDCLSSEQIRATGGIDLDELGLPFSTSEQLKNFDRQLSDATFRSSMVKALIVIGGGDIQSTISGILVKILRNALAEEYSFKGRKGKMAFKDFYNVVTLIIIVRTHKPHATDKEITEANSTWLSQAKTRRIREEAKQARCRAEKQKEASSRIYREDRESEM
ncbi:uncharacterized protein LOC107264983 isoform X2 [Cephus cinctus]|uniref:Uncharacterized protein LOC107264983 isoform X2 n=1 Tax=Cephus cinctus TaxID=211228 RepID=A0AAJ7VYK5_CEPCN|nr:uncharacterized protein LOC107264983 isoform X2 [Cephus cinctus]